MGYALAVSPYREIAVSRCCPRSIFAEIDFECVHIDSEHEHVASSDSPQDYYPHHEAFTFLARVS